MGYRQHPLQGLAQIAAALWLLCQALVFGFPNPGPCLPPAAVTHGRCWLQSRVWASQTHCLSPFTPV